MTAQATNTAESYAPALISIGIMYRDGDNYKDSNSYILTNKKGHTKAAIKNLFEDTIGTEEVLCRQWGLPNLSPIDHPSIQAHNSYDHCFNEITDIEYFEEGDAEHKHQKLLASTIDLDIDVIMEAAKNNGTQDWLEYDAAMTGKPLEDAKKTIQSEGKEIIGKHELESLRERALPHGIDKEIMLKAAIMALSNPSMVNALIEGGHKASDVYSTQAAMTKATGH